VHFALNGGFVPDGIFGKQRRPIAKHRLLFIKRRAMTRKTPCAKCVA